MRSEKKSLSIIPLMNEEENYSIPGNMQQCSQSQVRAQPQCARSSTTISSSSSPLFIPQKHPNICTHKLMHATFPLWIPLFIRYCSVCTNSPVGLGLFVTDTDNAHSRVAARFSPRCSQCPSTKPPHWEDSAVVTGGVNRRGGVTKASECVRFMHRLIRERIARDGWGLWM